MITYLSGYLSICSHFFFYFRSMVRPYISLAIRTVCFYFFFFSFRNRDYDRRIYHLVSSAEIKVSWEQLIDCGRWIICNRLPLNGVLWYPGGSMKSSRLHHNICCILYHWIPAIFLDCVLFCLRYPPVYVLHFQRQIAVLVHRHGDTQHTPHRLPYKKRGILYRIIVVVAVYPWNWPKCINFDFAFLFILVLGARTHVYRLCRVQRRIQKGFDVFEYYANNQWDFDNSNVLYLRTIINKTEKKLYSIEEKGKPHHLISLSHYPCQRCICSPLPSSPVCQ